MRVFSVSSRSLHQQPWMPGARVGRRLQRLPPRLACGLGIRLAAAVPAALAFARRHCSPALWPPAWRRQPHGHGRASTPLCGPLDGALLVSLALAACVVPLFLLPFAAGAPQHPGRSETQQSHAQAGPIRACCSRPVLETGSP